MKELTFNNHAIAPCEIGDGKIWFTADHLAELLEYKNVKQVNKIYQRHKDEFSDSMTTLSKVTVSNKNKELEYVQVRLFSPRGAHLIGMMSRTRVAKDLRIWLLDLAEKESGVEVGQLTVGDLTQLTGQNCKMSLLVLTKSHLRFAGRKAAD